MVIHWKGVRKDRSFWRKHIILCHYDALAVDNVKRGLFRFELQRNSEGDII